MAQVSGWKRADPALSDKLMPIGASPTIPQQLASAVTFIGTGEWPQSARCLAGSRNLPIVFTFFLLLISVAAEQPPIHRYGIADGLPSNSVSCNHRDSHGFLWFCTPEGLSRFDGYTFVNYGVEQGLPDRVVTDFLPTRRGEYWVGTTRGIAHFNPLGGTFTAIASSKSLNVNALLEDHDGTIWVAADQGLFQLIQRNSEWALREIQTGAPLSQVEELLGDTSGTVWAALYSGKDAFLVRYSNGRTDLFQDPFLASNRIASMAQDRQGAIWVSTYKGLAELTMHPQLDQRIVAHTYAKWNGQTSPETGELFVSSDGRLWVISQGRYEIVRGSRGDIRFRLLDRAKIGFREEDSEGNFWWGNTKNVRSGFIRYGVEDGLRGEAVHSIFEGHDGQLYGVSGLHNRYILRFDGERFTAVAPKVPGHDESWDWQGWGWGQVHLQDRNGEWWLATGTGVLRYPKVRRLEDLARTPPKAFYPMGRDVFRLYEDSHGDIWIAAWNGLRRWDRREGRLVLEPADVYTQPTAFREDRAGNLWIGYWGGGLSRQRSGHREWIIPVHGAPAGTVFSLFLDHTGRMWAGTTRSGLLRIDEPTAPHPQIKIYSVRDGLSSNDVRAITEDHFGRIYFWTGRSVDRLDPDTGKLRRYTQAEGLEDPLADDNVAFCDHQGRLWFGLTAISRLDPQPDRPPSPPTVRITKIRIRGADRQISELGESNVSGLILQPNENQVQIEFASMNYAVGDIIKYQYKLEGVDSDWSAPSTLRLVNYPALPSGTYRFLVRAINGEGLLSPRAASVEMRLLPPVWKRWWFLAIAGVLIGLVVYQLYRYRVEQLLALERVRTSIATDLHDDIGSSLTQIAIMSELARRSHDDARATERLTRISDLSRELVDSMSDIVWAINPKRDHLSDLIQRMRHFATEVLEAAKIEVSFETSQDRNDVPLQADVRREVFLVFKETLHNIVRHSRCERVQIRVELAEWQVVFRIRDDGQGFPPEGPGTRGHGLSSMRARAERLGASFLIDSQPGRGTTVTFAVPVTRSAHAHR